MLFGVQPSPVRREEPGAVDDGDPVLFLGELGYPKGDRRVDQVRDHVDLFDVEPFARDPGRNVRLVLMIGDDEFDRLAKDLPAEILDRHAHGGDRAFAGFMRELAGHVRQHADFHDVVGYAVGQGSCRSNSDQCSQRNSQRGSTNGTHGAPP